MTPMSKEQDICVVCLSELGTVQPVPGSEVDLLLRELVERGFVEKAWFRNVYTPNKYTHNLATLIKLKHCLDEGAATAMAEMKQSIARMREIINGN